MLLCLTGVRVGALTSLRVKYVELAEKSVTQNLREVATKFGKSLHTFFAKGFPKAEAAITAWMAYLEDEALFSPDDPLFPATAIAPQFNTGFAADGFERRAWKTSEPVRKIVNGAFAAAGLPGFGPRAFRHRLARHGAKTSQSVAEPVALSQNLGHTDVLTTLRSYGQIDRNTQRRLITGERGDNVLED